MVYVICHFCQVAEDCVKSNDRSFKTSINMFQLSELPLNIFKEIAEDSVDKFIGIVPNKIQSSQHTLSNEEIEELQKLFKSIFTQLSYSILSCEDLCKIFDNDRANFISSCYNQNKYFFAAALLKEHNGEIKPVLDNFDWKVKWIMGSSVSTSLKYPIVQLDLSTVNHIDDKVNKRIISCELNREELDRFILELDAKNK